MARRRDGWSRRRRRDAPVGQGAARRPSGAGPIGLDRARFDREPTSTPQTRALVLGPRPGRRAWPRQARWGQDIKMVLDRLRARSRCHHVHGASQACSGYAWERPSSVFSLLFFYSSTLRTLTRLDRTPRGLVGTRRGRDGSMNARAGDLAPFLCLGPNAPVAATHGVQATVRAPRLASVASGLARGRIGPDRQCHVRMVGLTSR